MSLKARTIFILLIVTLMAAGDGPAHSAAPPEGKGNPKRILFKIATVEERAGKRDLIAESIVEGPPGTDFNVTLEGERFKMAAHFLTDLTAPGGLKIRAKLDTRRLHGYSERGLPLYEVDAQARTLELGFDEQIKLLPFGRNGGDKLEIEITPAISDQPVYLPSGSPRPLEIRIVKPAAGGVIGVEASKIPHNFEAEVTLLEDGREVARGAATCLIEEAQEMILNLGGAAGPELADNPLAVTLTVNSYRRSRPSDQAGITFDVHRLDRQGGNRREPVALKWAGIQSLGSDLVYDLSRHYLKSTGKRYELRFNVKLAKGEMID